jgi:hypothetical protein
MALGAILGIGQALFGGISAANAAAAARRQQAALERIAAASPLQKESPELAQFYKQSESRYKENPFTTPYYLETVKQGDRAAANALGAMQTRGAALGSVAKINQILADTKNRGIAGAVQNKNAQFSQYGQAAQARAAEQNRLFNVNQQAPYERMLQLQQLKSQAANERYSAGMSTLAQGLSSAGQYYTAKEMYGNNNGEKGGSKGSNWLKSLFGNNKNKYSIAKTDYGFESGTAPWNLDAQAKRLNSLTGFGQ